MNGQEVVGSRQSNLRGKRNGKKRPRNEGTKKRILISPFAVAVALCSMHASSTTVAFFHPAPLASMNRQFQQNGANKHKRSFQKKQPTTYWTLGAAKDSDFDIFRGADELWRSIDDLQSSSNSLVVAASPVSKPSLPPWLACTQEELAGLSSWEAMKRIRREIESFEDSLMAFGGGNHFSEDDIRDVIRAIYWSASSNSENRSMSQKVSKIVGCVSFCKLLLQLEDDSFDRKMNPNNNIGGNKNTKDKMSYLISRDVLLASILHYSESVDLRYDGVYDEIENAIYKNSYVENNLGDESIETQLPEPATAHHEGTENTSFDKQIVLPSNPNQDPEVQETSIVMRGDSGNKNDNDGFESIFSPESLKLANAATQLKRIEILTSVTLASRGDQEIRRRPLSSSEYAAARNLMVSLTDDWRALAIRCTASLFRLEGILKHSKVNAGTGDFSRRRDAEATLTARDSLKMYANLSQQMGLHRLHSQLEAKAFRILYPRQYSASSALFQEHGAAMNAISGFLSNQLNQMLSEDLSLMYELEHLEVASRVKQPYSFWKKLLKTRIGTVALSASNDQTLVDSNEDKTSTSIVRRSESPDVQSQVIRSSSDLSILDVNDAVALRVIFKARKLHADESPETTRERERILCYYIHHMVRSKWPETDQSKVKDYVRYPKPNGYQSLHHTSKITRNKQDFHFEVQVRSEEMHRVAEFGVAAHSTYKLGGSPSSNILPSSKTSPSVPLSLASSNSESSAVITESELPNQSTELTTVAGGEKSPLDTPVIELKDSGDSQPYINALAKSRQSLMQSQVYVFLAGGPSSSFENGELITLSAGSQVIDVLETLRDINDEFDFEDDEVNVWRNGNPAPPEQNIENGDMILIQPTSSLTPITEILVNKTSSNTVLVGS